MVEIPEFKNILKRCNRCYVDADKNTLMQCKSKAHDKCQFIRRRNNLMFKFLMETGCRVSELRGIRVNDLCEVG